MKFYDRILSTATAATGTGNITWTTAVAQHALPPAGVNETVIYTILDVDGAAWETGRAVLTEAAGTYTVTRGGAQTVTASSNSGAAVSFTASSLHTLMLTPDSDWVLSGGSGEVMISDTGNITGTGNADILIPAGYRNLYLSLEALVATSLGLDFTLSVSHDAGGTWENNTGDYSHTRTELTPGINPVVGSSGDTIGVMHAGLNNTATFAAWGKVHILNPYSTTAAKMFTTDLPVAQGTVTITYTRGMVMYDGSTAAIDAVRITVSSPGEYASGSIKLYGTPV